MSATVPVARRTRKSLSRLLAGLFRSGRTSSAARATPKARPGVESLETRDLLSGGGLLGTAALPAPVMTAAMAKPAAPSFSAVSPRTILSVVTVEDSTPYPVSYQIAWPGQGWQGMTLQPNHYQIYSAPLSGAEPTIRFDWSYARGYQEQRLTLPSKAFVEGGPENWRPMYASDGMVYDFRVNTSRTGLMVTGNYALDTGRYSSMRAAVQQAFPSLGNGFEILGPGTGTSPSSPGAYNCIAWSMGIVDHWVWPADGQNATVADLEALYRQQGYVQLSTLDYSLRPGWQKVVIYGHYVNGQLLPTHAARQNDDGTWSSKLGNMALIRHATPDVFGSWTSDYGRPIAVFVRPA
jgi:hypothetical protein